MTLENKASMLSQHTGHQLCSDAMPHPRGVEMSTTWLPKCKML